MKLFDTILKSALLGLGVSLLAACSHTDLSPKGEPQVIKRNSVQMVRLPHEISSETDGTDTLSALKEDAINRFFKSINAGYGDVIMLDGPDASKARIDAIEALVKQAGLTYGGTSALGAKPKNGTVILYVERYSVTSPNCNYWPEVTSNQEVNNDSSFHGCATTTNLGMMVADPRDLVSGRTGKTSTEAAVRAIYTPPARSGARRSGTASGTSPNTSAIGNAANAMSNPPTSSGSRN